MRDADQNPVLEAISSRRSIRAFRPDPVPRETIERILETAARAPSGSNIQPWHVVALTGEALRALGEELREAALKGPRGEAEYHYYPREWREPYISRRRKVGWDLYASLGIKKGEKERMAAQHARNMVFFDAPVGLFFFMDRDMEIGSWLDLGMFLQNVMIAARGLGLDTCPQAAFIAHHEHICRRLGVPADQQFIVGMSLGLAADDAPESRFDTMREPVEAFTRFVERLE